MRWDNLKTNGEGPAAAEPLPGIGTETVVRTFDAPEALNTRFHEVQARSALNPVPPMSYVDFRYTVNPYRGCSHACRYCFARPTHTYLGFNAREDFEREIVVKVNLPELLRVELRRPSWAREHVALGTNTDPYQWVESRYEITRGVWEELLAARNPCSVLTKSPLLLRDIDLFKQLTARAGFTANLSIPTLDERTWRATEPATPHPRKRIEAVAELAAAGVQTGVLVAPLMPGINDSPAQVNEILELCGEAGADSASGIGLHLRGELRAIFLDWLRQYRPELLPRYERLYERRAYLPTQERRRLAGLIRRGRGGGPRSPRRGAPEPELEPAPPRADDGSKAVTELSLPAPAVAQRLF